MQRKGFTLIEALTVLFIFSLITMTFYSTFHLGTRQIIESKNRLGALAVANEKMEIVRNLEYTALGTKRWTGSAYEYGIPAGDVLEDEDVTVNTRTFHVHTFIQYVDDAFDGKASGTTPVDDIPNDYKRVKIEVSWGDDASQEVFLVSTFASKNVEVPSAGGVLSVNIIDSSGASVSQATVQITNSDVTPAVNMTTTTDSAGNLTSPGAAASSQTYRIQASKSGYYSATTYAPYPTSSFQPVDIHASVVDAAFNQKTLVIDELVQLTIATKDALGADLPNMDFKLVGGRKIGDTVVAPPAVSSTIYSLDQNYNSGTDASESIPDISFGPYTFSLTDTTNYQLLRLSSDDANQDSIPTVAGTSMSVNAFIADKRISSVLFTVSESVASTALQGAAVHLTNALIGYDATVTTDRYGQAYFPTALPALVAGTYDVTVSMAGYSDHTGTVDVTGSGLQAEDISLTAS